MGDAENRKEIHHPPQEAYLAQEQTTEMITRNVDPWPRIWKKG